MAQVFLSYDREDGAKARAIAQALERAGHFVWWDMHIKGGAEYGREIEAALEQADAVVVLWSERSVQSAWVRDEAAAGRDKGALVPVLLEPVNPPMGFRQYQSLDFGGWKGRGKPPRMAELLDSIQATTGIAGARTTPAAPATLKAPPLDRPLRKWLLIGGGVMLALLILGPLLGLVASDRGSRGVQTVAVTAAGESAEPMARDLLVKLGSLQAGQASSIRLLSQDESNEADLIFEVGSAQAQGQVNTNVVLTTGEDGAILWSKDFEQPSGKIADLKQQTAVTAARVLRCAMEGLNVDGKGLPVETLKLYLNACSELSETAGANPTAVIPTFRQVIEQAPRFEPAWANLLVAQSESAELVFTGGVPDERARQRLRQDIDAAKQVNPNLAEAILAEIVLLPHNAFAQIMALVDRADRLSPDSPEVLTTRSMHLRSVGRLKESTDEARRASLLDPLSPSVQNSYISALAYNGQLDAARGELLKAEQLWPGTASVRDAQYRFHLRYGDPKVALGMQESEGQGGAPRLFLEARADRTPERIEAFFTVAEARLKRMQDPAGAVGFMAQAYGEFGRIDRLFEVLLSWPDSTHLAAISDIYFRPQLKGMRHDPRFMRVAKRAGLLAYWRSSGKWPDFCFEPDLPYDCKAEAAKLG